MTEDRLDRVERIVSSLAESLQVNAQQIAENTRGLADLRQRHEADHERFRSEQAELRQRHEEDHERIRAEQAELRDQRERDEQDWREDRAIMQRAITSLVEIAQTTFARIDQMQDEFTIQQGQITTLLGQTQDTINQVRDLQVQGNRIMERLERLDGAG